MIKKLNYLALGLVFLCVMKQTCFKTIQFVEVCAELFQRHLGSVGCSRVAAMAALNSFLVGSGAIGAVVGPQTCFAFSPPCEVGRCCDFPCKIYRWTK